MLGWVFSLLLGFLGCLGGDGFLLELFLPSPATTHRKGQGSGQGVIPGLTHPGNEHPAATATATTTPAPRSPPDLDSGPATVGSSWSKVHPPNMPWPRVFSCPEHLSTAPVPQIVWEEREPFQYNPAHNLPPSRTFHDWGWTLGQQGLGLAHPCPIPRNDCWHVVVFAKHSHLQQLDPMRVFARGTFSLVSLNLLLLCSSERVSDLPSTTQVGLLIGVGEASSRAASSLVLSFRLPHQTQPARRPADLRASGCPGGLARRGSAGKPWSEGQGRKWQTQKS